MLSWKVVLVSAAVMFAALGLKVSLPVATTNLPLLWSFFLLCFKPPYLFVVLNAIIITIVASSWFHHSNHQQQELQSPEPTPPHVESLPIAEPPLLQEEEEVFVNGSAVLQEEEEEKKMIEEEEEEEKKVIEEGMALTEIVSPAEKPLVSARFTNRKFLKSSSEGGRALRVVAKAKRQETLESTWKAITEGRSIPLSRHMKKSDTWHNRGNLAPPPETTFNDVSAGRLRKEPSLSQDDLNRRVEAFIRKFNQDMRLQRQQSLEQYMQQMINRGAA